MTSYFRSPDGEKPSIQVLHHSDGIEVLPIEGFIEISFQDALSFADTHHIHGTDSIPPPADPGPPHTTMPSLPDGYHWVNGIPEKV